MGWLARLFGQERPQRPPGAEAMASRVAVRAAPRTPWHDAEDRLVALFAAELARFATAHAQHRFYGFGVECDLENRDIRLCANTPEGLRERALEYTRDGTDGDLAEEIRDLRWRPGYWVHHGLEDEPAAQRYAGALPPLCNPLQPAEREAALQCICRALLRLEREGHLDLLPRTLDFELVCTEINEDPFDSDMRLQRLRRALS